MAPGLLNLLIAAIPAVIILILFLIIITQGYVKAPPDHAYIISGLRKEPRVLIGRAGFKIPFFEQLDKLYLGQITVDIKTDEYIPTNDFINVMVDAVAKIEVEAGHGGTSGRYKQWEEVSYENAWCLSVMGVTS